MTTRVGQCVKCGGRDFTEWYEDHIELALFLDWAFKNDVIECNDSAIVSFIQTVHRIEWKEKYITFRTEEAKTVEE